MSQHTCKKLSIVTLHSYDSFNYNQQDATLYNILYYFQALHVLGGFSAHHQELKNCTRRNWYVPGLLAATASGAGSKPGTYQMLGVQFLSS